MKRVLIHRPLLPQGEELLKAHDIEIYRGRGEDRESFLKDLEEVDAFILKGVKEFRVDEEALSHCRNVKIVARYGVGYEMIDVKAANAKGIICTNTPAANSEAVAEHAVALMLACAKKLLIMDKRIRDGIWDFQTAPKSKEMSTCTLGILGCGRIGSLVAEKASGLGMKIIGYDAFLPKDKFSKYIQPADTVEEVLAASDFVTLHIFSAPENYHFMNAQRLALMKKDAYLLNLSRGEIVDEEALADAIRQGNLAGAGLDVYEHEPINMDNPLFELDNVIMTPHTAANTYESNLRASLESAQCVIDALEGKTPKYVLK